MSSFNECINEQGPIISTLIFGVLFVVSEVFPYIKQLEGNGIVDEVVKIIRNKIKAKQEQTEQLDPVENV